MADHPPPLVDLLTATEILHRTTVVIFSTGHHLRAFLILSFLLFSLNNTVENITHFITTHIDNNPFIESFLSTTLLPPNPTTSNRHRHRPTWGILDQKPKSNDTSLILDSFNPQLLVFSRSIINNTNESTLVRFDLQQHHELINRMLFLTVVVFASLVFLILASIVIHPWVHGVAFVLVVNNFLNNNVSLDETFNRGRILGSRRLFGFMLTRFAVRIAFTQLLGLYHFANVKDPYSLLKIFVRLMFLPFSTASPSVEGFEIEIYSYMLSWTMLEMFVTCVFAMGAWVAMVDLETNRGEVIDEGLRLFSLRLELAVLLKFLEGVFCGEIVRHIATNIFGKLCASMIQSFMEVYFIVALMLHYFSAKSMDAAANGVAFGQAELAAVLEV